MSLLKVLYNSIFPIKAVRNCNSTPFNDKYFKIVKILWIPVCRQLTSCLHDPLKLFQLENVHLVNMLMCFAMLNEVSPSGNGRVSNRIISDGLS